MSNPEPSLKAAGPAPVFAALGDATRLELLSRLIDGHSRSIAQLSEGLRQTRQGVTKHLSVLEGAGMVRSNRVGREMRFTFVPESVENAQSFLDRVSAQWDAALQRLQTFVETTRPSEE